MEKKTGIAGKLGLPSFRARRKRRDEEERQQKDRDRRLQDQIRQQQDQNKQSIEDKVDKSSTAQEIQTQPKTGQKPAPSFYDDLVQSSKSQEHVKEIPTANLSGPWNPLSTETRPEPESDPTVASIVDRRRPVARGEGLISVARNPNQIVRSIPDQDIEKPLPAKPSNKNQRRKSTPRELLDNDEIYLQPPTRNPLRTRPISQGGATSFSGITDRRKKAPKPLVAGNDLSRSLVPVNRYSVLPDPSTIIPYESDSRSHTRLSYLSNGSHQNSGYPIEQDLHILGKHGNENLIKYGGDSRDFLVGATSTDNDDKVSSIHSDDESNTIDDHADVEISDAGDAAHQLHGNEVPPENDASESDFDNESDSNSSDSHENLQLMGNTETARATVGEVEKTSDAESEVSNNNNNESRMIREIESLKTQLKMEKQSHQSLKEIHQEWEGQLQVLRRNNSKYRDLKKEYQRAVKKVRELAISKEEYHILTDEVGMLNQKIEDLEAVKGEYESFKPRYQDMSRQLNGLESIQQLYNDLKESHSGLTFRVQELEITEGHYQDLSISHSQLVEQMQSIKEQNDEYQRKEREALIELGQLQGAINHLKAERSREKQESFELSKIHQAEIINLQRSASRDIDAWKTAFENEKDTAKDLKMKHKVLEESKNRMESQHHADIEEMETELAKKNKDIERLRNERNTLGRERDAKKRDIDELQNRLKTEISSIELQRDMALEEAKKNNDWELEKAESEFRAQMMEKDDQMERLASEQRSKITQATSNLQAQLKDKEKEIRKMELEFTAEREALRKQHEFDIEERIAGQRETNEALQRALVNRSRFKAISDREIANQLLQGIGVDIDEFARRPWDSQYELTWPFKEHQFPSSMNKADKRFLIQNNLWTILYEKIFCTPFRVFGEEGQSMEKEWTEKFGEDTSLNGAPCPPASPQSEQWRYKLISTCIDTINQSPADMNKEAQRLRQEYDATLSRVSNDMVQELRDISAVQDLNKAQATADRIAKKAAKLWMDVGQQRCRMFLVMSATRQNPMKSTPSSVGPDGTLGLVKSPELRRLGNVDGEMLDKNELVKGCGGDFKTFRPR